jgi:hypothetical protein
MGRLRIAAFAAATLALCSFAVCGSVSGTRRGRGADHHTGHNPFESILTEQNVPGLQVSWQAQLGAAERATRSSARLRRL